MTFVCLNTYTYIYLQGCADNSFSMAWVFPRFNFFFFWYLETILIKTCQILGRIKSVDILYFIFFCFHPYDLYYKVMLVVCDFLTVLIYILWNVFCLQIVFQLFNRKKKRQWKAVFWNILRIAYDNLYWLKAIGWLQNTLENATKETTGMSIKNAGFI